MNKTLSFLLVLTIFMTMLSAVVSAEETTFELYAISYEDGTCTVDGRYFPKSNCVISLRATAWGASATTQGTTNADGSFSLSFAAELASYHLVLSAATGEKMELAIDLSGLVALFALKGDYAITSATYTREALILQGTHSGRTACVAATLKNTETGRYHSVDQILADESGAFTLMFLVGAGDYTFNLKSEGLERVSCGFSETGFYELLAYGESNYPKFLKKLESYVETLEALAVACQEKGITTDYETAKIEIIKKYISNIKNEIAHDDDSRMGQYLYTFTRVFDETQNTLEQYLNNEKTPFAVSRYVTGDIRIDGTSVLANTDTNGVKEEKPVFFVGYGHWETAANEIPFFSRIGLNTIQTEIGMWSVFVPFKAEGWSLGEQGDSNVVITPEQDGGNWMLKVENPDAYTHNIYRYIFQKIPVKPNTTYTYGLKAKGTGVTNGAAWLSALGRSMDGRQYIASSADWQSYDFSYTTGENETQLEFGILFEKKISELWLDDCYLKEGTSGENLLTNGDFSHFGSMTGVEREAKEKLGVYIDDTQVEWLRSVLKSAEENNVLVDLNICPHYMPTFIEEMDPESTASGTQFLPFSLDNTTIRTAIGIFSRMLAEVVTEYDSCHSICITNEPAVRANEWVNGKQYYQPHWKKYLEEKYQTIGALNTAYGLSGKAAYASFDSVVMPTGISATPLFYDYRCFNDQILTEFHQWMTEEIRNEYPELLLHTKIMDYIQYDYKGFLKNGANYEKLAPLMDVNGCDAFSYYQYINTPLTLKMGWYDYMTSLKNVPIWDTESHVNTDKKVVYYDDLMPQYIAADVWNGAVHGRGTDVIWLYDMQNSSMPWTDSSYSNANAALRPADMLAVSKTTMDLNRLSREVTALQKAEAKVGLLYSRISLGYNSNFMATMAAAYEDSIFSGQKVGFVTDETPEAMRKYELLIVPEATHVSEQMLTCMQNYLENGGEVLLLGENSLKKNAYGKTHDTAVIDAIYQAADSESSVTEKIQEMALTRIQLVDTETGQKPDNLEWSYAQQGSRYLIHIANYDETETKNIKVVYGDKEITGLSELRSGTKADVLSAKPYEPMLVAFDIFTFDLLDQNGTVTESNISTIKHGTIACSGNTEGTLILALYKDDTLIKASIGTGMIEVPELAAGSWRLMATNWDMETLDPLIESRNITMEVAQ